MKKNRIFALALAMALCFALLAGCGNTNQDQGGQKDAAASIKIGVLAPLTGGVAQYGNAVNNGVQLYVEEYNAAGGLNGTPIELVVKDEEGDAPKAVTLFNQLLDEGVTAVIGSVTSTPTLAVVPEAFAENMPMITASATANDVTVDPATGNVYTNMFRSCFIDSFQGAKMAEFAADKLSAQTAAVLFCSEDDYSVGLKDSFVAQAAEMGMEVVATEAFGLNAVDYRGQLTNIAAKNPDVLYIAYYYENVALAAPQIADIGLTATLLGGDGWDGILNTIDNPQLINGAYYCSGYSTQDTSEKVQNFLSGYKAKYNNEEPTMFAAQGYDAAMILIAAMEKATGEVGSEEYRLSVIEQMSNIEIDCVTGHVTFDEQNNPQKSCAIITIENGEGIFWGNY